MRWPLLVLGCLRLLGTVLALISQDQALAFIISVTRLTQSSWVPATQPPRFVLSPGMPCKASATPAALASTTPLETSVGGLALAPTVSSTSSKTFWRSMTLCQAARKMLSVRTASTGNSSKATAAKPPQHRANPPAPLPRLARKPARRPAGGAASMNRPPRPPRPQQLLRAP